MKRRIYGSRIPEEEVRRAWEYIGTLRGPKFVAPVVSTSLTDPAMDNNVTRISFHSLF